MANLLAFPDNNTAHLYPEFKKIIGDILYELNRESYTQIANPKFHLGNSHIYLKEWRIYEGFRSKSRQQWLYGQGRTGVKYARSGPIVTDIDYTPYHGNGIACDIVPVRSDDNEFSWDFPYSSWELLGHVARLYGMKWGGDWKSIKDLDHVQGSDRWITPAHNWTVQMHLNS